MNPILGIVAGSALIVLGGVLLLFLIIAEKMGWMYFNGPYELDKPDPARLLLKIASVLIILGGAIVFGFIFASPLV